MTLIVKQTCYRTSFLFFSFICCCSVTQSCLTLCDPVDCIMPGFPVLHHLPEFAQTYVHGVDDAIQTSQPLLCHPSSPSALNPSQHQGVFQWVSSLHHVAEVLELQLQHQSFQWIFMVIFIRTDWSDLLASFLLYLLWLNCISQSNWGGSPFHITVVLRPCYF